MEPSESLETPRSSATPALAVGIPAILILAALPFLRVGDGTSIPKLSLFLGRFHPTLLHLPVALLLLALLLELIRLPRLATLRSQLPQHRSRFRSLACGAQRLCGRARGMAPGPRGGLRRRLLDRHLWSGVATAIGAFGCVLLRSLAKARPDRAVLQRLATALLVVTGGTMIFAAHAGGSLTHGEGFLTEHAPAPIRLLAGLPIPRDRSREALTPIADREAFDGVALRIFENHCTACHNPGKLKGNLRLDTYEGVLAGGQSGPVVVAGIPGPASS